MINDEADEIIKEFFDSLKNRYQNKNKNATINPINKKDNNCFQYTVTVALNQEEIKKNSQKITKNKPFINKYNSGEKNFLLEKEKNLRKII